METIEESLNDTAHILSATIEESFPKSNVTSDILKKTSSNKLTPIFFNAKSRNFEAKIYSLTKTETDIQAYVTDKHGIVVYDSEGYRVGLDYSKFNDVFLTLKGKYGARSSKLLDPTGEGALFVAAPIRFENEIIGVITVIKPKIGVVPFIEHAKEKFWRISIIVGSSIAIVFSILAYLMFRPIGKLSHYVTALRNKERSPFPKIGLKELELLGKEIDSLVKELEGKEYIENYIQTLTHEIKSPLSSILASAELLENNPEKKDRLTDNIQKEGKRIQNIIEQLLELSALEGKRFILRDELVDLWELAKETTQTFSIEKEAKNLTIKVSGEQSIVRGDKQYLAVALRNLIRNSIEFANNGDTISFLIHKEVNGMASLEVLDEGTSIPGYALTKVTERFYSLPRPDTKQKSSGLGLSIVKQIAELHNASLEVQNREGKGVSAKLVFKI
jgi:two-component system sensor histidine kinase CreC